MTETNTRRPTVRPAAEPPEGLPAERRRRRDLRALAGGRRLRARRRRLDRRPRRRAVHDHPAAAERHRLAPSRPRPAGDGRGPDDPARPDARAGRRSSCPGLDHASIAAQFVLDRILAEGGREPPEPRPRALPRADAGSSSTRPARRSSARSGGSARRSTGAASASRWTTGSAKAVRVAFKTLYDRDLAYRTEALVNWCPGCRTSVSDLEVISTPETGTLWSVRYHLVDQATGEPDPDATITVATTRPETILGDTAVAVHPDDARYARPRRADASGSRSSSATCRSSPTRSSTGLRDRRGEDHAGPRPRRLRDGAPARPADADDPRRRRRDREHRHGLRRAGSLRGARGDPRRPPGPRRPRRGASRTRWSSAAASARTT